MTMPSFLKTINMKHLLRALSNTQRTNPSPFYLIKMPKTPSPPAHPDLLFLNRTLSNAVLQAHPNIFSIWSPQHLQRLQDSSIKELQNKVLITNPYKSEYFISQALSLSIKSMAINSLQQFQKIEKIKNQHIKLRNKQLDYHWTYSDDPQELENIKQLRSVIKNVIFDWSEIRSSPRIDQITQKIINLGCTLQNVVCSGRKEEIDEIKRWSVQNLYQRNKKLMKKIEIRDVSDTQNYLLAARSRGKGSVGVHPSAQELIDVSKCDKESVMILVEKQEWLLSKISRFPLEEEPYLYEMDIKPENKELQMGQASIV